MLVSLQKATLWVHFFGSALSLPAHNIVLSLHVTKWWPFLVSHNKMVTYSRSNVKKLFKSMPAQSRHNLQIKGMYTCLEICDPSRTGGTGAPSCSCSRRSKGHRCVLQLMPQMTNRKFAAGKREMDQKTPCLPAMLAYHWRELPQVSFLLWQRRICRDKMCFVTTKLSLWLLFWQAYFCCNKHVFPEKTSFFVCDKSMLVMTNTCLLRQKFCCNKNILSQHNFVAASILLL